MTKQRKTLLMYLSEHTDLQLSAEQIAHELADKGISLSAVYRNLADLEADGSIRRFTKGGSRKVYYQYINTEKCKECLHLSCKNCGKTFHMNTNEANLLIKNISQNENFEIDINDTVLYGVCKACQKN